MPQLQNKIFGLSFIQIIHSSDLNILNKLIIFGFSGGGIPWKTNNSLLFSNSANTSKYIS